VADTLAPLLHWRVCHVWDWLVQADVELGFPTFEIAEVYGHDPQDDLGETDPMQCPDGLYWVPAGTGRFGSRAGVGKPQVGVSGSFAAASPAVLGGEEAPVSPAETWGGKEGWYLSQEAEPVGTADAGDAGVDARRNSADQDEVNRAAAAVGQPAVSLINDEELARIRVLIDEKTWPEKWDGTEHRGDEWLRYNSF
jgi:DNA sulfur modification protein DndC